MSAAVKVELLCADLTGTAEAAAKAGIIIENVRYLDELHWQFSVPRKDFFLLQRIAEKRGGQLQILDRKGLVYWINGMLKRKILTFGLLFLFLFSVWLPNRIFFVEVKGNQSLPERQIIEAAFNCGLRFGAKRREIRSEKVKNALLSALPQLQWAGVNTYGCRAVITVRERKAPQETAQPYQVSSIVALRDGIVRQMTVTKGSALCKPGQAVKRGEILVSGYVDCGICVQAGASVGEIYADTQRHLTAVFPTNYSQREKISASGKKISLIIGKKRINLSKGSGISGTTCAKIYEEKYLTLPGGFTLPVAVRVERWFDYETEPTDEEKGETLLSDFAYSYLPGQMIAGRVERKNELFFRQDDFCVLEGSYGCYEMIGITVPEERLNE